MSAPIEHRALIRHDEVMQANMASRSRPVSVGWVIVLLMVGLILAVEASHVFAFWFIQQLPFPVMFRVGPALPTAFTTLFVFIVVILIGAMQNWAIRRSYLRNFTRLGIPKEIDALFEVLPEGLRVSTERITIFPRWEAIDRIERHELGWVLSADQLTFLIPHEGFTDQDAERAFVTALAGKLTPEARERSNGALEFAAG